MPAMISSEDAQYAIDLVKRICTEVGPGLPGSDQERKRAELIKRELEVHLGAENVTAEKFTAAPWAFLSAYPLSAICMLISAALNLSWGKIMGVPPWLTATAGGVFACLALTVFTLQFILSKELVDVFFRKKQSVNVIGTLRKPESANVKRVVLLSGHHDSAPENTWLGLLGYGFFFLSVTYLIGMGTMLLMGTIQLAGTITGQAGIAHAGSLRWGMLVYPVAPAILFGLTFNRGRKNGGTVPGAADNLSACAIVVAMCRYLAKNPAYIPDETEIRFVSFGSEEAGLRGSRRYVEQHLNELKSLDARLLNIETVAHPEINILTSDMNGTVKNAPEMVKSVKTAAERAGIPHKEMPATLGVANDSGPFSQAGLKALTLLGFKVPQQMVSFYHQKKDTPGILTEEPLLNVLRLTFEWVRKSGSRNPGE